MINKRLFRTVKRFKDCEAFVNHVIGFLKYYNLPWYWTKEDLRRYWRKYGLCK